jgi:Flp pilus assembly protein TadD
LILSGCASAVPDVKPPPQGFTGIPEAPFARERKVVLSGEAKGLAHFMKGDLLLGEGDFDAALKEFELAVQENPRDAFLHFRLATLYLRKGDLKKSAG